MTPALFDVLVAVTATVGCFALAERVNRWVGGHPFTHPVLLSILMLVTALIVTGIPYARYFEGGQLLHFLLGPATVALALPFHRHRHSIAAQWRVVTIVLLAGSLFAMAVSAGLAGLGGASPVMVQTLLPKSATAPVAMDLAALLGGEPALAAALVILTGVMGAAFGPPWLRLCGVRDDRATGFALGLVSHGIGTAAAFRISQKAGAYASLGMALNAVMTTLAVAVIILVR